jgi:hypothetical protein
MIHGCTRLKGAGSNVDTIVHAYVFKWHGCGCNVMTPFVVDLVTAVDLLKYWFCASLHLPMIALEMTI